jgi:histidyl-tRNA synthetase
MEHFSPEIQQIKSVAIGAAAAAVRDLLKDKVPEGLQPHVHEMIHNVTHRLGGEDIKGPILPQTDEPKPGYGRETDFASRH